MRTAGASANGELERPALAESAKKQAELRSRASTGSQDQPALANPVALRAAGARFRPTPAGEGDGRPIASKKSPRGNCRERSPKLRAGGDVGDVAVSPQGSARSDALTRQVLQGVGCALSFSIARQWQELCGERGRRIACSQSDEPCTRACAWQIGERPSNGANRQPAARLGFCAR